MKLPEYLEFGVGAYLIVIEDDLTAGRDLDETDSDNVRPGRQGTASEGLTLGSQSGQVDGDLSARGDVEPVRCAAPISPDELIPDLVVGPDRGRHVSRDVQLVIADVIVLPGSGVDVVSTGRRRREADA